jgi:hypothetical protein
MASLHVKPPMFYPRDWDLAFYSILLMYSVHFKQPVLYIGMGLGVIPYFINGQFACYATDVSSTQLGMGMIQPFARGCSYV